ncbi:MAG: phosphate acyltransferase PlsX [Chloroflexota bacterium]
MNRLVFNETPAVTPSRARIAVDAWGGDYAPEEIVKACVEAAGQGDIEVVLVGNGDCLDREMARLKAHRLPIRFVPADDGVREGESPATALQYKPNASIFVAMKMLRAGEVDAVVSAGSSGATGAGAIRFLGMIPGIDRPAIAAPLGSFASNTILMDAGVNADCKPHHLVGFAIMGTVYAEKLLNVPNPVVGLLSTGAEEGKGSQVTQEAYQLLKTSGLNFLGNIEGHDVLSGKINVVICDGFVGNVLLKFYESFGASAAKWLNQRFGKTPLYGIAKKFFNEITSLTQIRDTDSIGGGLLWGVNGTVFILHGNSRAPQVARYIRKAKACVDIGIIDTIRSEVARMNEVMAVQRS